MDELLKKTLALAIQMYQNGQLESAKKLFRSIIAVSPKEVLSIASRYQHEYNNQIAIALYELILEFNPNDILARISLFFARLKHIYQDQKELMECRAKYEDDLHVLHRLCSELPQSQLAKAASLIGYMQPFLLPYQGQNDRKLQALYGDIVDRIMTARYKELEKPLQVKKRVPGQRIRIGFVSGFFSNHSNWKTHLQGWIKHINRKEFALYGYHTGKKSDSSTEEAHIYLERLTVGLNTLEDYCSAIRNDSIDILIFPEIGMDAMTMRIAALRLAPVQCTSWGHPNTSGLHTIDYFLSSDLMEPPEADRYYTEKLVRLPNLSIYYEPMIVPQVNFSRADFGLRKDAILYWCCQNPIKYLPQYDKVFVKIAKKVPNAQLVFVEAIPKLADKFRERLEKAFSLHGLNAHDYCTFLPRLNDTEFQAANGLMDIFLDSLEWSGCNSALEAISYNLPIVTFPGKFMRSRHTAAILQMMGMSEQISMSVEDYVERAIDLGNHPEKRAQMCTQIALNKYQIYRDNTVIKALENFFKNSL